MPIRYVNVDFQYQTGDVWSTPNNYVVVSYEAATSAKIADLVEHILYETLFLKRLLTQKTKIGTVETPDNSSEYN